MSSILSASSSSVRAVAMHGDKSQGQRERALANFEAGVVDTLVATDVAARGIDVAGITHVINYDMPATREDYVHRIGRTARAGATGVGVTLVAPEQSRELAGMVSDLGLHRELALAGMSSSSSQRGGAPRPSRSGRSGGRPGARTGGGPPREPHGATQHAGRRSRRAR
jgi:ATP-dependent RNA helicase RhlE